MIVPVLAFILLGGGLFVLIGSLTKGTKGIHWREWRYKPNFIRAIVAILLALYILLTYKR